MADVGEDRLRRYFVHEGDGLRIGHELRDVQDKRLTVPTMVPPFATLRRVQDKISAYRTLAEIGAPQPQTVEVGNAADLRRIAKLPVFVKKNWRKFYRRAVGTYAVTPQA